MAEAGLAITVLVNRVAQLMQERAELVTALTAFRDEFEAGAVSGGTLNRVNRVLASARGK